MHHHKLRQINETSLNILETVGIRLHHPDVLRLVQDNGIRVSGQTAFFTPSQVIRWVACAPSWFTLYARNSQHDMTLGADSVNYGAGFGDENRRGYEILLHLQNKGLDLSRLIPAEGPVWGITS